MTTAAAPRIPLPLLEALARFDDESLPIAEIARRVCAEADRRGLTRPSYERLRALVHELRRQPRTAEILRDTARRFARHSAPARLVPRPVQHPAVEQLRPVRAPVLRKALKHALAAGTAQLRRARRVVRDLEQRACQRLRLCRRDE